MKYLIIVLLFVPFLVNAQVSWDDNQAEDVFNAELIFEGVTHGDSFFESDGILYAVYYVKINKVFRGDDILQKDQVIHIVAVAPQTWSLNNYEGFESIIRSQNNDENQPVDLHANGNVLLFANALGGYPSDNKDELNLRLHNEHWKGSIMLGGSFGLGKEWKGKEEIYSFLAEHENITIPEEGVAMKSAKKKEIAGDSEEEKIEKKRIYIERVKNHNQIERDRINAMNLSREEKDQALIKAIVDEATLEEETNRKLGLPLDHHIIEE
ncbi:MAG: hypothetical protein HRT72_03755 [Flavobacteriales bacterium]|nr:hypothetical protein [Flavobacteriales bacterium]